MVYLFFSQGCILSLFLIYYLYHYLNNTNYIKVFECINLLFLICCLSPFIVIILCNYYDVNFSNNGIFAQYQKDFYKNYDQDLTILIIINSLIILTSFITFIFHFFIYNKKVILENENDNYSYNNNIYFYTGLFLNFIVLCIYLYISCFNNFLARTDSMTVPYLINSYLQNNTFIFNSFFILNLPLLSLIISLVITFRDKKLNYILLLTSITVFYLVSLRSTSITPILTMFFICVLFFKHKYKIIGICCLIIATLILHHIKSEVNNQVVSPCFSSVQISSKNIELFGRTLKGENIFENERSVIKNNQNQELHVLTYLLKFLTRLEFVSLSTLVIKENSQNNTYKYLFYKFIPRYFWKNKPIDNVSAQFNQDLNISKYVKISLIKLDIFTEGYYNFKYFGYFVILLLYLFIGLIISYIYNKSKIREFKVLILYCLTNYIWFDNHLTMILGDSIYDFVLSTIVMLPIYLVYKFKKNIYSS